MKGNTTRRQRGQRDKGNENEKKDFEERGFGREKGNKPLNLQGKLFFWGIWSKTKTKASKNKTKTPPPPPKKKQQVIGQQQQQWVEQKENKNNRLNKYENNKQQEQQQKQKMNNNQSTTTVKTITGKKQLLFSHVRKAFLDPQDTNMPN